MFWFTKRKPIAVQGSKCYVEGVLGERSVRFEIIGDFVGKHSPIIVQRQKYKTRSEMYMARGTLAELLSMLKDPVVRIVNPESGEFYDL